MSERIIVEAVINGEQTETLVSERDSLLEILRDRIGLTGSKEGCNNGNCGACSVMFDGRLVNSCLVMAGEVDGSVVETVEGIAQGEQLHPLQQAWIEQDVAQCGYCQAGQIMSAAALLETNPAPSDADIDAAMAGNYCRCGTYNRIRSAIHGAAQRMSAQIVDAGGERKA